MYSPSARSSLRYGANYALTKALEATSNSLTFMEKVAVAAKNAGKRFDASSSRFADKAAAKFGARPGVRRAESALFEDVTPFEEGIRH
jgi:hypothetical protein